VLSRFLLKAHLFLFRPFQGGGGGPFLCWCRIMSFAIRMFFAAVFLRGTMTFFLTLCVAHRFLFFLVAASTQIHATQRLLRASARALGLCRQTPPYFFPPENGGAVPFSDSLVIDAPQSVWTMVSVFFSAVFFTLTPLDLRQWTGRAGTVRDPPPCRRAFVDSPLRVAPLPPPLFGPGGAWCPGGICSFAPSAESMLYPPPPRQLQ